MATRFRLDRPERQPFGPTADLLQPSTPTPPIAPPDMSKAGGISFGSPQATFHTYASDDRPPPPPRPPVTVPPGGTTTVPPTANATPWMDLAATSAPASYNSPPPPANAVTLVANWINANHLVASQTDPNSLHSITQMLHQNGVNAQVDYPDANGHTGGILIDGHPYQLIDGNNNWTALQPWPASAPQQNQPATSFNGSMGAGTDIGALLDKAIADLVANHGATPLGQDVGKTLMDIIRSGKAPGISDQLVQNREAEAAGMRGQVADARAMLADRGLASEPGNPQGSEADTISRLTEKLAVPYSQAIGDVSTHAMDLNAQTTIAALQQATGMSADQANTILNSVGQGTSRTVALASIALQALAGDRDWAKFLANFGLTHDQVMEQLRQGRVDQVLRLAELFGRDALTAAGGFNQN